MFGLKVNSRSMFFDAAKVLKHMDRLTAKALPRFGAYVRQRARTSIRKRNKPSQPGQPPSSHAGDLRNRILFAYEPDLDTVVIGPTLYNQVLFEGKGMTPISKTVPQILEEGGEYWLAEELVKGPDATGQWHSRWQRIDLRRRGSIAKVGHIRNNPLDRSQVRKRRVAVAARPFMAPAHAAEVPKLPDLFSDGF